jgi:acyl-CoA thioesterase-1
MEEPNVFIRWAIYFFASGDVGIFAALSIAMTAILGCFRFGAGKLQRKLLNVVVAIAVASFACGSLPMPPWFQWITIAWLIVVLLDWRIFGESKRLTPGTQRLLRQFSFACSFIWLLIAISIELPFHHWSIPAEPISDLLVIGDSVTAGLNDGEDTWPRQLSRASAVRVLDASQPGATLQSGRQQNSRFAGHAGLVILEIGGNDMLEGLPVAHFEENLHQLLTEVTQSDRIVIMFELPLPPFHANYVSAQRRQAKHHNVRLIPKRLFAEILTTRGATVDGIHLSHQGQVQMKALVASLLRDRLQPGTGTYEQLEPASFSTTSVSTTLEGH